VAYQQIIGRSWVIENNPTLRHFEDRPPVNDVLKVTQFPITFYITLDDEPVKAIAFNKVTHKWQYIRDYDFNQTIEFHTEDAETIYWTTRAPIGYYTDRRTGLFYAVYN
jgi:hypothetical protein